MSSHFRHDPAERWSAYRDTVFDAPPEAQSFLAHASTAGIITASNPGRLLTPMENAERDEALRAALCEGGIPHLRVVGRSPDAGHGEASWAIRCPAEICLELGRKFGQEAVYLVRGEELVLVRCEAGAEEVPLGSWRERLVGAEGPEG